jgi:predicted dehydrogenase
MLIDYLTYREMPMTPKEIRVGIVGADTRSSWAKVSHVPAISCLRGLKLAAVATRSEQSAREGRGLWR